MVRIKKLRQGPEPGNQRARRHFAGLVPRFNKEKNGRAVSFRRNRLTYQVEGASSSPLRAWPFARPEGVSPALRQPLRANAEPPMSEFRKWFRRPSRPGRTPAPRPRPGPRALPCLEPLEERALLSTIVWTNRNTDTTFDTIYGASAGTARA